MNAHQPSHRPLMLAAHPGHELRVHSWCARNQPDLCVLTTGARNGADASRVDASGRLLEGWAGKRGPLFGASADRDVYRSILNGDAAPFIAWTEALTEWIALRGASTLVVDGWQGYNPAHDLVHVMGRCAAKASAERTGRAVTVLEFPVVPHAMAPEAPLGEVAASIVLTPDERARKRAATEAFPEVESERAELRPFDAGAHETLHHVRPMAEILNAAAPTPRYETYGEARVAAGLYTEVLRRTHVLAIAHALDAAFLRALPAIA